MRKTAVGLLVLIVFAMSACQGYRDGSRRTVGEFTDDARIQAAVKSALVGDAEIDGLYINVEVNRSVVSLYGRVSTEAMRRKALEVSGGVRGVTRVEDRLTLIEAK